MKYLLIIILAAMSRCNTSEPADDCIDESRVNPDGICTQQYDPVCGCNGTTYGNACMAGNAGVTRYEAGECQE